MRSGRGPFPETAAGGFTRVDGTVQFYVRIRALLSEMPFPATVLDFGAGRGALVDSAAAVHRELGDLRSCSGRVIGVDVDSSVRWNRLLDESYVIDPGGSIPLEDASVDLIVSDQTFEHLNGPYAAAGEITRVLRPGGWLCARTPSNGVTSGSERGSYRTTSIPRSFRAYSQRGKHGTCFPRRTCSTPGPTSSELSLSISTITRYTGGTPSPPTQGPLLWRCVHFDGIAADPRTFPRCPYGVLMRRPDSS